MKSNSLAVFAVLGITFFLINSLQCSPDKPNDVRDEISFVQVNEVSWRHVSSMSIDWSNVKDLPFPNVGRQAAALALDIDQNGVDDIVIGGWNDPSMVWLRYVDDDKWERYIIDDRNSHVEAGGAFHDITGNGYPDIVMGGSWSNNEVWWWENPYPDYDPKKPWKRYKIKDVGENQHHDQIFGDFTGDGKAELAFWNQGAQKLFIAEIPENPKRDMNWERHEIWSWTEDIKYEGFAKGDINGDGKINLVGGGYWFEYLGDMQFESHLIDDYGQSRSAVGDLIEGGNPEIVLGSGDGVGPLNMYEFKANTFHKTTLIDTLVHGHTLQLADFNGDGHVDIYAAEMYRPGAGEDCKQYILYGDGKGNFRTTVVSTGIGTHEGKVGDLNGNGRIDILQKDFQEYRRVDVWFNTGVK